MLSKLYLFLIVLMFVSCHNQDADTRITPNQFKGTDTERIQAAVGKAGATTGKLTIPAYNSNESGLWMLDSAILLPDNISMSLENCTIQLSDSCRDNMFRSDNVGRGITNPQWNHNISIIGIGNVILRGAKNPRSTGDASKRLSLNPEKDVNESGNYHISYGSDAGKMDRKQTGDWRNIMILMAYVDGFKLKNVTIENTHAWAISHERVLNADLSDIIIKNPEKSVIDGKSQLIRNRDGIDLRHGCKNFRINNISGITGDDFIALSTLGLNSPKPEAGGMNSTMVTSRTWKGSEDDTEDIYITNIMCESSTRAIAIRANDVASINNVYINGVIFRGGYNTLLVGGRGYGKSSDQGKINNIHAMDLAGNGASLIRIEEPIANCSFMNGVYTGDGAEVIEYKLDSTLTSHVITQNLIRSKHEN